MASACIIAIGSELALGQSIDTNSAWLAAELAAAGVRCRRFVVVPDELDSIVAAIRAAAADVPLVILTGGLGPTEDDLTREALAQASGQPLVEDAAAVESIRAFFAARGRAMPDRNRVQARRPAGGRLIANACGTAPGLRVPVGGAVCYALPGVPYEMKAMFTAGVLPELRAVAGGGVLLTRALRCFGAGESEIGQRIADLMRRGANPEVGTAVSDGMIDIRICAAAAAADAAAALLDQAEAELRGRLGALVVGREDATLASAVGDELLAAGETLSTAESCTGGLLGKLLTDVPGSSRYYLGGGVAYANALKESLLAVSASLLAEHGAVSEPVAAAMAGGARERFRSIWAISTTGVAGPAGGTPEKPVGLVYFGLAGPHGVRTHRALLGEQTPRESIRLRAAHLALNLVRLAVRDRFRL